MYTAAEEFQGMIPLPPPPPPVRARTEQRGATNAGGGATCGVLSDGQMAGTEPDLLSDQAKGLWLCADLMVNTPLSTTILLSEYMCNTHTHR